MFKDGFTVKVIFGSWKHRCLCFCKAQCGHGLSQPASLKNSTSKQWLFTCQTASREGRLCRAAAQSELHLAGVLFPTVILMCVYVCAGGLFVWSELRAVGWQAGGSFSVALWAYRGWPNTLFPSSPTPELFNAPPCVCSYNSVLTALLEYLPQAACWAF